MYDVVTRMTELSTQGGTRYNRKTMEVTALDRAFTTHRASDMLCIRIWGRTVLPPEVMHTYLMTHLLTYVTYGIRCPVALCVLNYSLTYLLTYLLTYSRTHSLTYLPHLWDAIFYAGQRSPTLEGRRQCVSINIYIYIYIYKK